MLFDNLKSRLKNSLIPSGVILFYMVAFSHTFPDGVNSEFVSIAWKIIIIFVILAFSMSLFFKNKDEVIFYKKKREKIPLAEFTLTLIPITPIVQYVILNNNILNTSGIIVILLVFLIITILLSYFVPWILSSVASRKNLMVATLSLLYVIFNMSSLSFNFKWHLSGNIISQLLILLVSIVFLKFLSMANKKMMVSLVFLFLFFNTMSIFASHNKGLITNNKYKSNTKLYNVINGKKIVFKKDIYLLIYDGYSNQETMEYYGFDNSEQIQFLKKTGFTIYPGTYSIGGNTLESMSRVLDVSYKPKGNLRICTSGEASVLTLLRENGYETMGIFESDYLFRGIKQKPKYDQYFPEYTVKSYMLLISSILEGEFRFDAEFEKIKYEDYLKIKREKFAQENSKPVFLYCHGAFPGHSQNSGRCRENEKEVHFDKIVTANEEMQEDIEVILKSNPDAIVIVAGDHGPYLTKNCTGLNGYDDNEVDRFDLQDRYGTFMAIRWPEESIAKNIDIETLQDALPAVLSYIYNDKSIMEAKVRSETADNFRYRTAGVSINNGIIIGGKDDGEPLFIKTKKHH